MILTSASDKLPELELMESWRIESTERFDFSGLVLLNPSLRKKFRIEGDFMMVSDRSPFIWLGTKRPDRIDLKSWVDLRTAHQGIFDLEALDTFRDKIYVANEPDGVVFEVDMSSQTNLVQIELIHPPVDLSKINEPHRINRKFGIESMAVTKDFIYMAKEKDALSVFEIPLAGLLRKKEKLRILSRTASGSQTDMKIRNNNFYILDREGRRLVKTQIPFKSESSVSFLKTIQGENFNYFVRDENGLDHPEWSTAEALDLTDEHIYIGLDNNGLNLRGPKNSVERRASLLMFKRPKGF